MQQQVDLAVAKVDLNAITKKYTKGEQNVNDITKKLSIYKLEYEQLQRKLEEFNREMVAMEAKYTEKSVEECNLNMKLAASKAGISKWDAKVKEFQRVQATLDQEDATSSEESLEDEEMETNILKSLHAQKDIINNFLKSNTK